MDFQDTPEEAAFRAEARAWLERHAASLSEGERPLTLVEFRRQADAIPRAKQWMATKADGKWACISWPPEFGGRAATRIQSVIWEEEEAKFRTPPNLFTIGQGMLGPTIMVHGTDEQKSRYLGPMLRADEVWCQLFSEPAAGSDLAGLATRAVRDGDDWIINGQKIWTSGAQYCDFGMLLTRTDPDNPKHEGITYFIVDMKSRGIDVRPIRQISGQSGFNEVFFTDLRVPDRNRIGGVNEGWRGALTTLMNERQTLSGAGAGPGFDELWALARAARRGGRPAIEDAAVRQRLADVYVKQKGVQFTRYRSLSALSRGTTPGPESSTGKIISAPLRQQLASFAMDLQGAAGAVIDHTGAPLGASFSDAYLAAPGGRIAGGTDEVLRNILAERVLGLPPEPRVDKGMPFSKIPTGAG